MDMIEKVARALARVDGKDPDAPAWIHFPSGLTEGVCWSDQYQKKARAAIEAILDSVDYEKGDKGNFPSECYADMFFEIVEALK